MGAEVLRHCWSLICHEIAHLPQSLTVHYCRVNTALQYYISTYALISEAISLLHISEYL